MATSTSLFSRARPGKSNTKKVRGFLSLPGELRNEVYQYCFEPDFRCEIAAKGSTFAQRKTKTVKLWAGAFADNDKGLKYVSKIEQQDPLTIRFSRPLGKYRYTTVKGLQTTWSTSLFAINLVCRQLHTETLPYIYTKTTFVFDASTRLSNFLNVVPRANLAHITKLQLHYTTYGCPRMLDDRTWQEKHNKSWLSACSSASKKFTGLRLLKIWVSVHADPLRFDLRRSWLLPLLQFRRLGGTSGPKTDGSIVDTKSQTGKLQTVDVVVRTKWSGWHFHGNQEVAKASEDLHRLFGGAISSAILGAKEEDAMRAFNAAWNGEYHLWQFHLGFAKITS